MVSKIIFCLVLKLGFMFPQTSVKQMYLTSQWNIFFCIQCFLLYMCLHFICCSFGQRQHSPFSLSRSLLLSLSLFFFPAWMYDPAHRPNHLRNFFRHIVCYFFLSTYTMNYLAPMNISSTKLQLIYLTAFLREYEVT